MVANGKALAMATPAQGSPTDVEWQPANAAGLGIDRELIAQAFREQSSSGRAQRPTEAWV